MCADYKSIILLSLKFMFTTWLMIAWFNIILITQGRRKDEFLPQRSRNSHPATARSMVYVCGRSIAGMAKLNLGGACTFVSWECCVLFLKCISLQRADPSSRGVTPDVSVSLSMMARNNNRLLLEEVILRKKGKKEIKLIFWNLLASWRNYLHLP